MVFFLVFCRPALAAESVLCGEVDGVFEWKCAGVPLGLRVHVLRQWQSPRNRFELTSIRTGGAAPAYLEGSATLPHLIVLDLDLPGMSGLEVLRTLQASVRWHDLPVIIRSGSQNPVDRQVAADAGASGYLTKPALFEAQLHEPLGQWQHLRSGTQRAQLATAG